ncbi:MAG: NADH-quinone oxidoreductase subunit L [Phycisphaerae bacterium]
MAGLLQTLLLLAVIAPLAAFAVLVFARRWVAALPVPSELWADFDQTDGAATHRDHPAQRDAIDPIAGWIATAGIALSLLLSIIALIVWSAAGADARAEATRSGAAGLFTWLAVGGITIPLSLQVDSLTIIMFVMITVCATCIHVFSIGYMHGDARFGRYFAFLSLFCFSMLGLVLSENLLIMFVFWELVGLSSYLLIGFWHDRPAARAAAFKAFLVNRVGDFGFMVGIAMCLAYLGTLSLTGAAAIFAALSPAAPLFQTEWLGISAATWLGVGLFCGAVGKSAQFPLHVWLPDAMEGPTPVSALIHAATMVAAGVYLVARVTSLLTPVALGVIAVIGCITLVLAALMALVQTDIKRILAYSTLSQLGYMIFAIGVGAWVGALFHLLTHAFFKALLFLGAGQVIHGTHQEQDIRKFGGLMHRMPKTAITMGIAVLAISGAGIPWLGLGIGGYYSKDEILGVTLARATGGDASLSPISWWLFAIALAIAYLTPLYMGRMYVLTFLGKPRDERLHAAAREHPALTAPLMILAAMTILSGWFLFRSFVAAAEPAFVGSPLRDAHDPKVEQQHMCLGSYVGFAWLVGLGGAWWLYRDGLDLAGRIAALPVVRLAHAIISRKFFIDELYAAIFVGGAKVLAIACRLFDEWVVDGVVNQVTYMIERVARFSGVVLDARGVDSAVNGVGSSFWAVGGGLSQLQTGRVRQYVFVAMASLASLLIFLLTGGDLGFALLLLSLALCTILVPWSGLWQKLVAHDPKLERIFRAPTVGEGFRAIDAQPLPDGRGSAGMSAQHAAGVGERRG